MWKLRLKSDWNLLVSWKFHHDVKNSLPVFTNTDVTTNVFYYFKVNYSGITQRSSICCGWEKKHFLDTNSSCLHCSTQPITVYYFLISMKNQTQLSHGTDGTQRSDKSVISCLWDVEYKKPINCLILQFPKGKDIETQKMLIYPRGLISAFI